VGQFVAFTAEERLDAFARKVDVDESGCFVWTATKQPAGYGMFGIGGAGRKGSGNRQDFVRRKCRTCHRESEARRRLTSTGG
jgi:hypothetical protein